MREASSPSPARASFNEGVSIFLKCGQQVERISCVAFWPTLSNPAIPGLWVMTFCLVQFLVRHSNACCGALFCFILSSLGDRDFCGSFCGVRGAMDFAVAYMFAFFTVNISAALSGALAQEPCVLFGLFDCAARSHSRCVFSRALVGA